MRKRVLLFLCFTAALAGNPGPSRADESAKKLLTAELAITLRSQSDLRFSPDGRRVAFVATEPLKGTTARSHIWMLDVASQHVRQFTFSEESESAPRWSPDGKTLAFLSSRGGQTQIYFLSMEGGDAYAVTEGKRSVIAFEWSPDGKQVALIAPEPKSEEEEKKEKDKDDARVVDKDDKPAVLWLLDVDSHKLRKLVDRPWQFSEIAWVPSGKQLIALATDHPESDEHTKRILSVSLADGKLTELLAPSGPFFKVRVSGDGKWISFVGCRVDGPWAQDLFVVSIAGGAPKNLTAESIDRLVESYVWHPDGTMIALIHDGFRSDLRRVGLDGKATRLSPLPVNPESFDFSARSDSEYAFSGGTATEPNEIWLATHSSAPTRVSEFNKEWSSVQLAKPEVFRFKSFDGTVIEAALLLPANYDGHSKLPLITLAHGGPCWRWSDTVENWGQLLVGHGYAIFYPNIRGSTGYGQKFLEMNRADWGYGDFKDVMAGVDALIARGVADPNRLGIGGWSYGGYMSEWAITQTDRFKAAVSGAGLANLISEFGTEDEPAYDEWYYGQPYDKPEGFLRSSPFMYMKHAKTPTLILQGENDRNDPLGQSQELYRALKHYGVRAELVQYPREPHGPQEEKHNLDILNRILRWYDENLK